MNKLLIIISVVFPVAVTIAYKSWTLGSESSHWKPVCVKGQLVYRANFAAKAMAVNALHKNGSPITCKKELK